MNDRRWELPFSRRQFLLATGLTTGAIAFSQTSRQVRSQPRFSDYPFQLGIASGDPLSDSVVLWTRLAPNPALPVSMPSVDVPVQWQIALDPQMRQVVRQGEAIAVPEWAHSVRVVAEGLESDREYWYQFRAGNEVSEIGRTRTLPAADSTPNRLAFAFVSCQNYEHGYFNAYRHLLAEDLQFAFHLGDYIYEYKSDRSREYPRRHPDVECSDLATYRQRYALYRSDRDLRAAHANLPFICTWDDHEVENDYADGESENFDPILAFLHRRAAAYQAYYEHLPLRPHSRPLGANLRLYRRFSFGDLAQFSILDTRQYRSDQACDRNGEGGGQLVGEDCTERYDPARSLLGNPQERWLLEGLGESRSRWNVIAQQYLVSELRQRKDGKPAYWSDSWDGYPVSRRRVLEFLRQQQPSNPIFIGGDIHSFWVSDLKPDFRDRNSPVVASEFVTSSISSYGIPYDVFSRYLPDNPHVKFFESRLRGYVKCEVSRQAWRSELRAVDTSDRPDSNIRTLATYRVDNGRAGVVREA